MGSRKIQIGLIGCGEWGKNILRDLVLLGCEVYVVAKSKESIHRAKNGGAAHIFLSLDKLPNVDGYILASPTRTHGDIIEKLISHSPQTPIFTEKPLCIDVKQALRLSKKAPHTLFVMDKWRYHTGILEIARIAKERELGNVLGLKTTRVGWGNPHDDIDFIWHLLPHDIAITLEILGNISEPQVARVEIVNGQPATFFAIMGTKPWQVIELSTRYVNKKREIMLFCEKGTVVLEDGYASHITITQTEVLDKKKKPQIEIRKIKNEMPLYKELEVFIKHLNGGTPPKSSAKDGAEIVATITQLRKLAGIN